MSDFRYVKWGTGGYRIYYGSTFTGVHVRKVHGYWQYQLDHEEGWRGAYRLRTEAGRAGLSHIDQKRTRGEEK